MLFFSASMEPIAAAKWFAGPGLTFWSNLGGEANYEFVAQQIDEEYALLLWRAQSPKARINAGVDTFVIRAGLIVMQSVFYELEPEKTRTHKPRK